MSFKAMNWAIRQKLPGTQKLVLMMLADRHNSDNGQCNPSHSRLIEDCGLARSTVIDNINKLVDAGYLKIVSRSKNGVKVPNQYSLLLSFGVQEDLKNDVFFDENEPSETPQGVVRQSDMGSPAIGQGWSGNRTGVVRLPDEGSPANGHKPVIKPVIPNTAPQAAVVFSCPTKPDDVSPDVWQDFMTLRKAKKAPGTKTAIDGIRAQAGKAGMSLDEVLRMCCERGWTGFKADWVLNQPAVSKNPPLQSNGVMAGAI